MDREKEKQKLPGWEQHEHRREARTRICRLVARGQCFGVGKLDEGRTRAEAVYGRPQCHADHGFVYPTDDKDPLQISGQQPAVICFPKTA